MSLASRNTLTLAVYPMARGFGWVAFEGPFAPYDWDLVETRKDKNAVCLRKVEDLLDRLQPEALVLEAFERRNSSRRDRIANLCRGLCALAQGRGVDVAIYERRDICGAFEMVGARTRHEIAEAVARHVPVLRDRLPAKRRPWKSEDRRMALFSAAAVVLTHYRYNAEVFFDELKRAA